MRRILLCLFGWLVCYSTSHAIVRRDDTAEQSYRDLAAQSPFDPVGRIAYPGNIGTEGGNGSGTLIGGQWVLTAAHVVWAPRENPAQIKFFLGNQERVASQLFFPPGWNQNESETLASGQDIALIKLDNEINGVSPARLVSGNDIRGNIGYAVGYGSRGDGTIGDQFQAGFKLAMKNNLDIFADQVNPQGERVKLSNQPLSSNFVLSDFDNPLGQGGNTLGDFGSNAVPIDLEGCAAPGDSGGGVFIDTDAWYLASVIAIRFARDGTGGQHNSKYGNITGSIRVSEFRDWITTTVPEPSTLVLNGVACWVLMGMFLRGLGSRRGKDVR